MIVGETDLKTETQFKKIMLVKLQVFLKDNNLDIMEYWINDQNILYFIRVLQKKSGLFLLLKMKQFHIRIDEVNLVTENKFCKILKFEKMETSAECSSPPEELLLYYDMLMRCIPECRKHFLIQISNCFMLHQEACFQLKTSNSMLKHLHWMVELEWFYENVNSLDFETNRWHQMLVQRMMTQYDRFLRNGDHFLKRDQTFAIQKVWDYYELKTREFDKYKKLYLKIVFTENILKNQYVEMENIHEMGTFDFNESLRKQHRKGLLRKKLQKLYILRCESILDLNDNWNQLYNVMIEILYFANELKIVLSRYNTLFVNIENFLV